MRTAGIICYEKLASVFHPENMQEFVDFWFIIVQSMENVFTEKWNSWIVVLL